MNTDPATVLSALAFCFATASDLPYLWAVVTGRAKITTSTWLSWCITNAAIVASMYASGAIAWQIVGDTISVAVFMLVGLYCRATTKWTRIDSLCVTIVVLAILGWYGAGDPLLATILCTAASVVGTLPFIWNVWRRPQDQVLSPWVMMTIGSIFGVLGIREWDMTNALSPIVFLVLQLLIVGLVVRKYKLFLT